MRKIALVLLLFFLISIGGCKEASLDEEYENFLDGKPLKKFEWTDEEWTQLASKYVHAKIAKTPKNENGVFSVEVQNEFCSTIPFIKIILHIYKDGKYVGSMERHVQNLPAGEIAEMIFRDLWDVVGYNLYVSLSGKLETIVESFSTKSVGITSEMSGENLVNQKDTSTETEQDTTELPPGEMIGYFQGIEWGDYPYFIMEDLNGETHSFSVTGGIDFGKFENDESLIGKKVKVKLNEYETYIPEGGDYYTITELLSVEVME